MSSGYGRYNLVEVLGRKGVQLRHLMKALYPPMPTLNIMEQGRIESTQARIFRSGTTVINVGSGSLTDLRLSPFGRVARFDPPACIT